MGRQNRALIEACEQLRRTRGEDSLAYKLAARRVDDSQASCRHKAHGLFRMRKESVTGKYHRGELWSYCLDCSKPLQLQDDRGY